MSRQELLSRGAAVMVVGAAIFLIYAIVFLFRAFAGTGFEIGVATINEVKQAQLNELNLAVMSYIAHLHVATAGFLGANAHD